MLPKQIVCFLNFFDSFGYYSESSALAKYPKVKLLLFIIQILLATDFTLYFFRLVIEFHKFLSPLEIANEMLQYTMGLCTYWLIVFDSFYYRRKHRTFWKMLERIDTHFCKQSISFRVYLCKFIEFFLVSIISYTFNYVFHAIPPIDGVFIYLALIVICQLRIFYYVFCVEIVNWQLQVIQQELIELKEYCSNAVVATANNSNLRACKSIRHFNLKRLKWVNEYYGYVIEMTELLNTIFSWSQFPLILYGFYSLLTDLNWCYASLNLFPSQKYFGEWLLLVNFQTLTKVKHWSHLRMNFFSCCCLGDTSTDNYILFIPLHIQVHDRSRFSPVLKYNSINFKEPLKKELFVF